MIRSDLIAIFRESQSHVHREIARLPVTELQGCLKSDSVGLDQCSTGKKTKRGTSKIS